MAQRMANTISRRSFVLAGASVAGYAFAQDATFSSDVNVVNVYAAVHDKSGKVIRTLQKEDFTIEDEGKPQPIRYFAQQSDLPLTLGLLVDTSGSQRNEIEPERHASIRFFEQVMRPDKDKAFVIHFDYEVELLQDLTSSRGDLEKALDDLQVSRPQMTRRGQGGGNNGGGYPGGGGGYPGGGGGRQGGGGRRNGGTDLYDAVALAADDIMKKQQGRKAVILLSDGVDTGSKLTLSDAIESAQRADMLVYSIRFYDKDSYQGAQRGPVTFGGPGMGRGRRGGGLPGGGGGYPGGGGGSLPDGKKTLQRLAEETGGGYFEVSGKRTLGDIYTSIEDELRNQYSLGFTPDKGNPGFHRLHVTVKDKALIAQARTGYYAR
jgi:VWFA-related protein